MLPDHAGGDWPGDLGDQIEALAIRDAVEDAGDDLADRLLVVGDARRRERLADDLLEAVVARRVHRDHLQALDVQRNPDVVDQKDPALLRGEGREVTCRGVDVVEAKDRPEAALVRRDRLRREMHGLLALESVEELIGRAVIP